MSDDKAPVLEIDELMDRVRSESRRDRGLNRVDALAEEPGRLEFQPARFPVLELQPAFQPSKDHSYHVRDFLRFHDADFIANAYRGLLGREPDTHGLASHLQHLRAGTESKVGILGGLRWSAEGRNADVRVRGLAPRFALDVASRIPVVGYLGRLVVALVRLPSIVQRARRTETYCMSQLQRVQEVLNELSIEAETQVQRALDALVVLDRVKADAAPLATLEELDGRAAMLTAEQAETEERVDVVEKQLAEAAARIEARDGDFQRVLDEHAAAVGADVAGVSQRIDDLLGGLSDHWRHLEALEHERDRVARLVAESAQAVEQLRLQGASGGSTGVAAAPGRIDAIFSALEDRMRGSREDIRRRSAVYLPLMADAKAGSRERAILDVGAGRGEWLELLRDEGLLAEGIDVNDVLVQQCRALGLVSHRRDGLEHLRTQANGSLGAVTAIHVVEHLPLDHLVAFLDECFRALATRGAIVLETPNPYNLVTAAVDFWRDPSHLHPVHPESLKMLLESMGFVDVEAHGLEDGEDGRVMKPLVAPTFETHEAFLSSPRDYVVVARKP